MNNLFTELENQNKQIITVQQEKRYLENQLQGKERDIERLNIELKTTKDDYINKASENMKIEERITKIEERNKRVELDKSWETSWTRKICIMILTYIVVIIYSYLIREHDNIFLSSLVPVIGFTLSTFSLKMIRKVWEKSITK